jgi:hypothetical protein
MEDGRRIEGMIRRIAIEGRDRRGKVTDERINSL